VTSPESRGYDAEIDTGRLTGATMAQGMTKKDFEAIQTALADLRGAILALAQGKLDSRETAQVSQALESTARDVATVLARQNAKFSRERFLAGCRGDGETDERSVISIKRG
jgi:uncharacterized membrane protein